MRFLCGICGNLGQNRGKVTNESLSNQEFVRFVVKFPL
jgi:hypothetical protein